MTQVLVLDSHQRSALAATRSLGGHGLTVHVADSLAPTLAGASRYARSELICPDPASQPDAFRTWVIETTRQLKVQAVLPLTDLSIMLLAPQREQFGDTQLLCASDAPYNIVSDKAKLIDLARSVGVRTPQTEVTQTREEAEAHLNRCRYPVVLKPARSKVTVGGRIMSTGVGIARSRAEALEYLRHQKWLGNTPCLLQEYIEGHGAGVFALYAHNLPVAWFSHRRIREKPPSGGVSVLCESTPVDPVLRKASVRILDAVGWDGPAMVEFKVASGGEAYLMEINGRLWGSLQLAIDCGMDFPWLMYQSALGEQPTIADAYLLHRRLRWLLGDVDNLLIQIRQHDKRWKSKLAAVGGFLGSFVDFSARQEVFRWSDPMPGARELRSWLGALT